MTEIRVVLKKEGLKQTIKDLDRGDECDDDKKNYWLVWNEKIEEMYLDEDNGETRLSLGSNTYPSIFITIPFSELMKQFARFDFFGKLSEFVMENYDTLAKNKEIMENLQKFLKTKQVKL